MKQSVYVLLSEAGNVKIGRSKSPQKRAAAISTQGGFKIIALYSTEPCSNADSIERSMHKLFACRRICGEWFSVGYEEAVAKLQTVYLKNAEQTENTAENSLPLILKSMCHATDILSFNGILPPYNPDGYCITDTMALDWSTAGEPSENTMTVLLDAGLRYDEIKNVLLKGGVQA